jgi:hypothetical protein
LKGAALEANVTTGGKIAAEDKQELNLFTGPNSQTDSKVAFDTTEPASKDFLSPKDAGSLPKPSGGEIRIGTLTATLKPHIGAVAP